MSKEQVTVAVQGGFSTQVDWCEGMNAQDALEKAYCIEIYTPVKTIKLINPFAVQYYGEKLGYMVIMLANVYDIPGSGRYWEFSLNGKPSLCGIDSTKLKSGDVISFQQETYHHEKHEGTALEAKHKQFHNIAD